MQNIEQSTIFSGSGPTVIDVNTPIFKKWNKFE